MKHFLGAILAILLFGLAPALAQQLTPIVPKASGKPHPEGNEYMRINHMDMLKHERDLAVREGIRDKDNSLAQCISCHVVKDANNQPVTYDSPEHFCRVCHDYVAVKLDCFSCHNSVPEDSANSKIYGSREPLDGLLAYIEELENE